MSPGFTYSHTAGDRKPITGFKDHMAKELRRMAAGERCQITSLAYYRVATLLDNIIIEGE